MKKSSKKLIMIVRKEEKLRIELRSVVLDWEIYQAACCPSNDQKYLVPYS